MLLIALPLALVAALVGIALPTRCSPGVEQPARGPAPSASPSPKASPVATPQQEHTRPPRVRPAVRVSDTHAPPPRLQRSLDALLDTTEELDLDLLVCRTDQEERALLTTRLDIGAGAPPLTTPGRLDRGWLLLAAGHEQERVVALRSGEGVFDVQRGRRRPEGWWTCDTVAWKPLVDVGGTVRGQDDGMGGLVSSCAGSAELAADGSFTVPAAAGPCALTLLATDDDEQSCWSLGTIEVSDEEPVDLELQLQAPLPLDDCMGWWNAHTVQGWYESLEMGLREN